MTHCDKCGIISSLNQVKGCKGCYVIEQLGNNTNIPEYTKKVQQTVVGLMETFENLKSDLEGRNTKIENERNELVQQNNLLSQENENLRKEKEDMNKNIEIFLNLFKIVILSAENRDFSDETIEGDFDSYLSEKGLNTEGVGQAQKIQAAVGFFLNKEGE